MALNTSISHIFRTTRDNTSNVRYHWIQERNKVIPTQVISILGKQKKGDPNKPFPKYQRPSIDKVTLGKGAPLMTLFFLNTNQNQIAVAPIIKAD